MRRLKFMGELRLSLDLSSVRRTKVNRWLVGEHQVAEESALGVSSALPLRFRGLAEFAQYADADLVNQ
jgi:hypothetical protein